MEQRCLEPDRGWLGGYWVGEVLRPLVLLEPMVNGGVDMLSKEWYYSSTYQVVIGEGWEGLC